MEPIKTILIDDERSSLENLEQKIREFCPELEIIAMVEQPTEALLLIRHHKPDVIFLDIEMPGMDGFAFLPELRRRGRGRTVPVVVLTAKDLTAADRQLLGEPIEKILRKESLGHEQLLAEVSALMAGHERC